MGVQTCLFSLCFRSPFSCVHCAFFLPAIKLSMDVPFIFRLFSFCSFSVAEANWVRHFSLSARIKNGMHKKPSLDCCSFLLCVDVCCRKAVFVLCCHAFLSQDQNKRPTEDWRFVIAFYFAMHTKIVRLMYAWMLVHAIFLVLYHFSFAAMALTSAWI